MCKRAYTNTTTKFAKNHLTVTRSYASISTEFQRNKLSHYVYLSGKVSHF